MLLASRFLEFPLDSEFEHAVGLSFANTEQIANHHFHLAVIAGQIAKACLQFRFALVNARPIDLAREARLGMSRKCISAAQNRDALSPVGEEIRERDQRLSRPGDQTHFTRWRRSRTREPRPYR